MMPFFFLPVFISSFLHFYRSDRVLLSRSDAASSCCRRDFLIDMFFMLVFIHLYFYGSFRCANMLECALALAFSEKDS